MNYYREWLIRYHGDIEKLLQGTNVMLDIINERYAIIKTHDKQIPYLNSLMQIEYMEEAKPVDFIKKEINLNKVISLFKEKWELEKSGLIITNIEDGENTIDVIRIIKKMIKSMDVQINLLVILLSFDISTNTKKDYSFIREIIDNIVQRGKIIVISILESSDKILEKNLAYNNSTIIFLDHAYLVEFISSLISDWSNIKKNSPYLYGQKIRVYYIKKLLTLLKKEQLCMRSCNLKETEELLGLTLSEDQLERFKNLELAYEFAPEDAIIDVFIKYNSFDVSVMISTPQNMNLYPLVFPYLGVRGTVRQIKNVIEDYLGRLSTGALAYILGTEPLVINEAPFKPISILDNKFQLTGENSIIGIIDTGIDYTHPAFIDEKGKTRIISIWDQTVGDSSPYGYGTIYDNELIN